jgi:putative membrane protein
MIPLATLVAFAQRGGAYGPMGGPMPWAWGWMLLIGTVLFVGLIVVIALAVWAAVRAGRQPGPSAPPSRPRAILDERYARGEISTEEYRERLQVLEEGPRGHT